MKFLRGLSMGVFLVVCSFWLMTGVFCLFRWLIQTGALVLQVIAVGLALCLVLAFWAGAVLWLRKVVTQCRGAAALDLKAKCVTERKKEP